MKMLTAVASDNLELAAAILYASGIVARWRNDRDDSLQCFMQAEHYAHDRPWLWVVYFEHARLLSYMGKYNEACCVANAGARVAGEPSNACSVLSHLLRWTAGITDIEKDAIDHWRERARASIRPWFPYETLVYAWCAIGYLSIGCTNEATECVQALFNCASLHPEFRRTATHCRTHLSLCDLGSQLWESIPAALYSQHHEESGERALVRFEIKSALQRGQDVKRVP